MKLSLLSGYFFQAGYVTRDLDAGVETMKAKTGARNWQVIHLPKGGLVDGMAFSWVKGVMLELIAVDAEQHLPVYANHIPETAEKVRFHHLGFSFDTEAEYHARVAQSQADGFGEAFSLNYNGILTYYSDSYSVLGHYTEFVHCGPGSEDFFANVPHN
jgi:hypothetical protein